jgi:hypothetical protein
VKVEVVFELLLMLKAAVVSKTNKAVVVSKTNKAVVVSKTNKAVVVSKTNKAVSQAAPRLRNSSSCTKKLV